jgi:uncharacterized protein DUF6644
MDEAIDPLLDWIKASWLGQVIQSTNWIFSTLESVHFIAVCFLFGSILIVDLKLLGFLKGLSYKRAMSFLPITIGSFMVMLLSGIGFIFYNPHGYYNNIAFRLKMLFLLFAGINALLFTIFEHRKVIALGPNDDTTAVTKVAAALSLAFWFLVLGFGRSLPLFSSVN